MRSLARTGLAIMPVVRPRPCCLATERGVQVCAPVHDALLIEAPANEIGRAVAAAESAMREASSLVLGGFSLRTDPRPKVIHHPDRYTDPRGEQMWRTVMDLLHPDGAGGSAPPMARTPDGDDQEACATHGTAVCHP